MALSVALGAVLLGIAGLVGLGRQPTAEGVSAWPRARRLGVVLGLICLVWSAYHGTLMLEGGLARFRPVVWGLVPVIAVLAYRDLDYLLARALGGFLVLSASFLLHGAFVEKVYWRPLYGLVCYALGIWGMSLIAAPWYLRDLLQRLRGPWSWRRPLASTGLLAGLVLVILPLWRRWGG